MLHRVSISTQKGLILKTRNQSSYPHHTITEKESTQANNDHNNENPTIAHPRILTFLSFSISLCHHHNSSQTRANPTCPKGRLHVGQCVLQCHCFVEHGYGCACLTMVNKRVVVSLCVNMTGNDVLTIPSTIAFCTVFKTFPWLFPAHPSPKSYSHHDGSEAQVVHVVAPPPDPTADRLGFETGGGRVGLG